MNELMRTPEVIAIEINSIKSQTRQIVISNSIEIGRRLVEAKELIGHGDWGTWLKDSVEYSQSTAENLIKIFKEFGSAQITLLDDNLKSQAFGNLSYSQALALLGLPADQREDFIKENKIDDMSTRELQQAIKEKKELEQKLKEAEDKAKKTEKLKKELDSIKNKHKEDITNKEMEIENYKLELERINIQLKAAESSGNSEDVEKLNRSLEDTQSKLSDAADKIKDLEQQLKDKPVDVITAEPQIIEKIPEDVEKELKDLRLKAKLNGDKAAVKFSIIFDQIVKNFNDLLNTLTEVQDEGIQGKYKAAVNGLLSKMQERL